MAKQFEDAIEVKQTAEQLDLKAQRDLESIKFEAEAESPRRQKEKVPLRLLKLRKVEPSKESIKSGGGHRPRFPSENDLPVGDLKNLDEKSHPPSLPRGRKGVGGV